MKQTLFLSIFVLAGCFSSNPIVDECAARQACCGAPIDWDACGQCPGTMVCDC